MLRQGYIYALLATLAFSALVCSAQDYDDEGYGNNQNNNQGDGDNTGYGSDDGYNQNLPNYQQNVDPEGSNNSPSNSYPTQSGSDADGDYDGEDGSVAAASEPQPSVVRIKRSVEAAPSEPKLRVKRHGKYYIGPVYTYVKTDKHANFKWGVKHKVGKKHHG